MGYMIYQADLETPFVIRKGNLARAHTSVLSHLRDDYPRLFELAHPHDDLAAFLAWTRGWELIFNEQGDVERIQFMGEKANPLDDDIFRLLAPFVEPGSYIEMSGEQGERWRWLFDGVTVKEETASLRWETDPSTITKGVIASATTRNHDHG